MRQGDLFADGGDIPARDPNAPAEARPRLARQCRLILERLRAGPATNDELSRIARKYTSRTSDLRAAGYDVRVWGHDRATGLVVYGLGPRPEAG